MHKEQLHLLNFGFITNPMRKIIYIVFTAITILNSTKASAQQKEQYVRIARLVIDSTRIEAYNKALKEHAEIAVKVEPGVIMLYAVQEKENPSHVSVFEIYANEEAYKKHITTAHFLKYKTTVQDMVKSLQLIDVVPIALESKLRQSN